ncbi:AAA family ATPase [Sediminibacillus albus]|uniref:Nuclease SbcCD subunit C n=1 Tax=Sediminibacillus albus TaxID=407036 RepID=A0A1G8VRP6_9BACI|nr:AAA family ATPase [Sediminibacillus albus]SDJ68563.1 exonuclease SbcC [Sediminibacillus albus]
MRAISLSMTAFGPYKEKQTVDFREIGEETIFLITGPTGAGKTTIFDAICYALYGRASGSDRDHDSLRSHFAEIDFSTEISFCFSLRGKTYHVTRYPKQLKRKARGEGLTEDPARAELYEIQDGQKVLLSSKIKDVNETLEEKLGLDYEQFRKMIMIPQGEFRKLISENSKEREEILQKIFHTYFYEKITDELKKQSRELHQSIQQIETRLEQEADKITWRTLEPEETDSIEDIANKLSKEIDIVKQELAETEEALKREKTELNQVQAAYYHGKQLEEKYKEYDELKGTEKELTEMQPVIESKQEKQLLAEKAAKVIPFEEQALNRKREWDEQAARLKEQKEKKEGVEQRFEAARAGYEKELNRENEREKLKETIETNKKQLEKLKQYKQLNQEKQKVEQEKLAIEREIVDVDKQLDTLISKREQLEKKLQAQNQMTKEYYKAERDWKEALEKPKKLEEIIKQNDKLKNMRNNFQNVQKQYGEKQKTIETLQKSIKNLEDGQKSNHAILLAQELQAGKACPVCGSTEHPVKAAGTTTEISDHQLEELHEKLEAEKKSFNEWQNRYIQVKSEGQAQRSLIDQLYQDFETSLGEFNEQAIHDHLKRSREEVESKREQKEAVEKQLKSIEEASALRERVLTNIRSKQTEMENKKQSKEKVTEAWLKINMQMEHTKQEIGQPDKDPADLQKEITAQERSLTDWLETWEKMKQDYQESKEQLQQFQTILQQQDTFTKETEQKYSKDLDKFESMIASNGFSSIAAYQSARLTEAERSQLQTEIDTFNQRKQLVKERLQETAKHLENSDKPNIEKLQETLSAKEKALEQVNQTLQQLKFSHHALGQISDTMHGLLEEHHNKAKQYYDIGELADLARGENHLRLSFERYVLSSFLDEILLQANLRFGQMTEHRYQLIRSDQVAKRGAQSGLDLEVLDHHTGQQRSVKTLSGGEGFKASLSLALGMADVVQAHAGGVQLETLFIDEGFGTLDELSLEQAIECLKGLQQSNRVLGIISHVPQLKEEIPAKLQITPSQTGSNVAFTFS